jgi:hypothetical protein
MPNITKEQFDEYCNKSFFTEKNFNGKISPETISKNMIPYGKLQEFHYQISFFLNFYSSLYIELKYYESTINYDISKFSKTIENLGIIIDNTTQFGNDDGETYNLSSFPQGTGDRIEYKNFIFYNKTFENHSSSAGNHSYLYTHGTLGTAISYSSIYSSILDKSKPEFGSNPNYITLSGSSAYINDLILVKGSSPLLATNILTRLDLIITDDNRTKFKEIIEEVLSQKPENILGYLLNKKIYYNIILYNISIQYAIRVNFINDSNSNIIKESTNSNLALMTPTSSCSYNSCSNLNNVKDFILENKQNINKLNEIHFSNDKSNEYLIDKNNYINKINILNTLKTEYIKTQDKLNISTKLYNQQYKNYNSIKTNAIYIIIVLIIIILSIISISIFPIFTNETKNSIYIILLIILIVITYLYYINYKYVILYENFDTLPISKSTISVVSASPTSYDGKISSHKTNNNSFYNLLITYINDYTNAITDIFNNMRMNIYTIGNKSFSQDANIYLYKIFIEKKRQLEINNVKLTNLFNVIEILKKQILYLFNIILIIACFIIILLISLVIYSLVPHLYIYIIILCVVLITILMIYFTFAIIQPTRMIMNKNYWANNNPSINTMGKL